MIQEPLNAEIRVKSCRLCNGMLATVLDLGLHPPANALAPDPESARAVRKWPLLLMRCTGCGSVQLGHNVPPHTMFDHYLYRSGTSTALVRHFEELAHDIDKRVATYPSVAGDNTRFLVDVGSNDGTLLRVAEAFPEWQVLGVEPASNLVDDCARDGLPVEHGYFTPQQAGRFRACYGAADVVVACNVFAHAPNLNAFLGAVRILLDKEGWFVFEVYDLLSMLRDGTWDAVYTEHYFTHHLTPLQWVLAYNSFRIVDVETVSTHGGSLRCWVQDAKVATRPDASVFRRLVEERVAGVHDASTYEAFAARAKEQAGVLGDTIRDLRRQRRVVAGYSCPAKASTLIHFAGLTADDIAYVVDDNPDKVGRFMPGTGIPVVPASYMVEHAPDDAIIFAWNIADDLIPKLPPGVRPLVPMPTLRFA